MAQQIEGSFNGGESTLLASNVFKIYVTVGALHFARVADRFTKELLESGYSAAAHGVGGLVMKEGVMKPAVNARNQQEGSYDQTEPGSAEFSGKDKRNFSLKTADVNRAILSKVTTMTQGPGRVGFLELQLATGKKRKFTLTGSLDHKEVERLVRLAFPTVEGALS